MPSIKVIISGLILRLIEGGFLWLAGTSACDNGRAGKGGKGTSACDNGRGGASGAGARGNVFFLHLFKVHLFKVHWFKAQ